MDYLGAPEEAILEYQRNGARPARRGRPGGRRRRRWMLGRPGFARASGSASDDIPSPGSGARRRWTPWSSDGGPTRAWPDGNASLLRLLAAKLIPASFPDVDGGRPNQENIVKAGCDYTQLDRPANTVRIRLNSLVIRGQARPPRRTSRRSSTPIGGSGEAYRVRAQHVVMACWNRVTAQLVDGPAATSRSRTSATRARCR